MCGTLLAALWGRKRSVCTRVLPDSKTSAHCKVAVFVSKQAREQKVKRLLPEHREHVAPSPPFPTGNGDLLSQNDHPTT